MTWFKVDDGVYDHPKFLGLSMAARGLWMTCGTWCSKHLTDGVIPARQVKALGGTRNQVDALIRHGLWVESLGDSGAKSYAFHGWNDMQPSRKEILDAREAERERKREWRERKAAKQGGRENVPPGQDVGQDGGHPRPVRPTRPDPSRPVPTTPANKREVVAELTAARAEPTDPPSSISIREPWVDEPRSARCSTHRDDPNPPACRACGDIRKAHEAERDRRNSERRAQAEQEARWRKECPLCDQSGYLLPENTPKGLDQVIPCTHSGEEMDQKVQAIVEKLEESDPEPRGPSASSQRAIEALKALGIRGDRGA